MKKKTILKKVEVKKTKTISIRIPDALHHRIELIRCTATSNGLDFSLAEYLSKALSKAVDQAENELKDLTTTALCELNAVCLHEENIPN